MGKEYFYKGKLIDPDTALRIVKIKKDGTGLLDRRYRINREWKIVDHLQDYYDRIFLKRAII